LKIHIESVAKRQPRDEDARDERTTSARPSASTSKGAKPPCPIIVAI
jgi:hypothetical protein